MASVVSNLSDGYSKTFGYEARELLDSAAGGYGTLGYTYNLLSNRATKSTDDGSPTLTDTYSYPSSSNRLSSISTSAGGTRTLSYDAAGNTVSDTRNGDVYV